MQTACVSTRRRAIGQLAVGAAAAAAAAVPAIAEAAPDPVLPLAARYDALERQGAALLRVGDEDGGATLLDAAWRAGDEAIATSPTTVEGLAAQLRIMAERLSAGTRGRERDGGDAYAVMRHAQALAGRVSA